MGLFSFFKKEKPLEKSSDSTILGMVLLQENKSLDMVKAISELENKWGLSVKNEKDNTNETSIVEIGNYRIAIAEIPAAIPTDEAITAAEYNLFWENGAEKVKKHKGHVIISIMNAGQNAVEENILFSKIASAILNSSKSIGIYIGGRSLAIEKEFYISQVETMTKEDLPLYIWIYFGLRQENNKQSIYTYGLKDFGKKEMEILNSDYGYGELSEMMFNLSHYVLAYDVNLKHGETIGLSAEQKLKISESKGVFLDGNTLKIEY